MATTCLHWITSGVFFRLCLTSGRQYLLDCFRALLVARNRKLLKFALKKNFRSTNKCHYSLWTMFLCAWHCTSMITFNTDNNPLRQMVIIIHFLDGGTDSSKSDTITGRARIPTQSLALGLKFSSTKFFCKDVLAFSWLCAHRKQSTVRFLGNWNG